MSVVIVGGNERMEWQYESICKEYGYKAKIYTKENGSFKKKLGCPDLLILTSALQEAKRSNIPVARIHTSSASALHSVLTAHAGA